MIISRITRSLSARLLGVFLVTSIVYAFASWHAMDLVLDNSYLRQLAGAHISLYTDYVLKDIGIPPDIAKAKAIARQFPLDIHVEGPGLNWSSTAAFPPAVDIPFQHSEVFENRKSATGPPDRWESLLRNVEFARYQHHAFFRLDRDGYVIVFASPKLADSPGVDLTGPIVGLVSILVLAGCYFGVRWLVKPVQWIKEGAGRIGRGDLDYRIKTTRRDDLGELAVDINRMADDVQEMLEAKSQLLLAISHELRSPLTRAKVALEFLEDEKVKQDLLEDIQQMEQLIADLLESERLNTRHSKLKLARFELGALVKSVIDGEFMTEAGRIQLRLPDRPVEREVDVTRLRLLIKNLIDNALCYSPKDGKPVEVTLGGQDGAIAIRVKDYGKGMSAGELSRVTEPFYRADPARSRCTGGFGLGLYLCRRIAEAHGGSLVIASQPGQGTEVTVRLPAG